MKILALDPATRCGWAHSDGTSGVWDLSVKRDESGGMRLLRLGGNLKKKLADPGVGVVVFEAARHAKGAGALVVQSELQGVIKLWCEEEGIPYCGYSPTSIKKHATGRGNASKDEMLAAAREKWPDKRIADDNEADALWLLNLVSTDLVIAQ